MAGVSLDAWKSWKQAQQKYDVPICAIGGLTVENSQVVIEAGASLCAARSGYLCVGHTVF